VILAVLDAKIAGYVNTTSQQALLLDIHYQQRDSLADVVADPYTLAVIDFDSQSQIKDEKRISIGTPALTGGDLLEVWRTNEIPESGKIGDIHFRSTSAFIFGQILISSDSDSMESLTQSIYQQISQLQHQLSFPKMIRVWNYLPWINRHDDGLERYQSFCVGRHQAIDTSRGFETHLPAATAVGTNDGGVLVYFLAAREDGIQIENPRQVSAFAYPSKYAPKSPTFSRAVVKQWGEQKHLYISGTASILGHETQHVNKLGGQLDECLNNMDILISEADNAAELGIKNVSDLTGIKIYLRNKDYLQATIDHLKQRVGDKVSLIILNADICRDNLLLEIEGFYSGT